jgi:hypothetical protein
MNKSDEQILKKHSPEVRGRAYIEIQIVRKLVETAKAAGYNLLVEECLDDEATDEEIDIMRDVFNLDEATVIVNKGEGANTTTVGWVRLVMGNSGYDIISDYATSLEEFLKPVNVLADWWGE